MREGRAQAAWARPQWEPGRLCSAEDPRGAPGPERPMALLPEEKGAHSVREDTGWQIPERGLQTRLCGARLSALGDCPAAPEQEMVGSTRSPVESLPSSQLQFSLLP